MIKGVIESKDPKLTSSDPVEKNRVHKSEDSKPKVLEFERQNKVDNLKERNGVSKSKVSEILRR